MKILITGITGFLGTHLSNVLLNTNKFELIGTYQRRKKSNKF